MKRKENTIPVRLMTVISIFVIAACIYFADYSMDPKKQDTDVEASQQYLEGWIMAMDARAYISNDDLRYDESYFAGGYPEENKGVCTDVVWNAFDGVGITLKTLVDEDIEQNFAAYSDVISIADPNIDFRRVPVLEVFFERHAESLTTDYNVILAWMPGDIVIFESSHVAVVSGLRNIWGRPYIIQHGKDPAAEEDRIWATDGMEISGHYRWRF